MVCYEFNSDQLFTLARGNGRVWQQIEGDDRLADWSKAPSAYVVVISPGMFATYNFRVLKNGAVFNVRRVRSPLLHAAKGGGPESSSPLDWR